MAEFTFAIVRTLHPVDVTVDVDHARSNQWCQPFRGGQWGQEDTDQWGNLEEDAEEGRGAELDAEEVPDQV